MKIEERLIQKAAEIPHHTVVGIDIGSRQSKAVLLTDGELETALIPTGFYMQETAEELLKTLLERKELHREDLDYVVVTGYGRVSLQFSDIPYRTVTEIACHGRGAHYLAEDIRTVIDIGGQDSKAIRIDPANGTVLDFAMNDKCAAGTGRFLEKIANVLGYDVTEMGPASLEAQEVSSVNSTCVVFAESEVVSLRAKGTPATDIAAGIHFSVAKRVNGLLSRIGIESNVLFSGGVSNNPGMRKAFEDLLGVRIAKTKLDTVFAGALGAAVYAAEYAHERIPTAFRPVKEEDFRLDLSSLEDALEKAHKGFVAKNLGKKAYVAYTCNYTPMEVLAAADVAYFRLMHRGTPEEIIAGETLTQSMLCDFNKSLAGGFIRGREEYKAIDKLYTFFACACMRNTVEAIDKLYVPAAIFNLPRHRHELSAKAFLATEIRAFREDLEELTGVSISEDQIREKALLYNEAKHLIREIAEYRKKELPPLTSGDFQKIIHGYYSLPVEELIEELKKLRTQLQNAGETGKRKLRLMLAGGSLANGDDKVIRLVEEELGEIIVVEDNCTGIKPLDTDVDTEGEGDIYDQLSDGYLEKAPCARMYEIKEMVDYSLKLAQEYDVDGVILYYLKFCPCYSMTEKLYTDLFRAHDIPLFILQGDYAVGDEGQIKTRLEAFTELLWERREKKHA